MNASHCICMEKLCQCHCSIVTINAMCEIDIMFITIEHKNLEIRKHVATSSSGTKPFNYFWVKRFRHKERHTIFLCWLLHLAPISCGTHGTQIRLTSANLLRPGSSFNSLTFFEIPKILRALLVRDVTRTFSPVSSSQAIGTSLSDMSALCTLTRYHLH